MRGALGYDQDENADTAVIYLQEEFSLTSQLSLQAGLRYDHTHFAIDDRFLANGDQSNKLSFDELNPMAGAVYSFNRAVNVYVNCATAFETPTFTEFAPPADVNALGKGIVLKRVSYQLAFFDRQIEDEVTTVENRNGRAFFNNADTARRGFEASMSAEIIAGLSFTTAYTYSDFSFDRFVKFPGVENNRFNGKYNDAIRIQEAKQRYFEPAPDVNVFGALRVRFDFAV